VFTTMKPIKSVTIKHTMESKADVSKAKTIRLIILTQLRGEAGTLTGYCGRYACMLLGSNASIRVRKRHSAFSFCLRLQACTGQRPKRPERPQPLPGAAAIPVSLVEGSGRSCVILCGAVPRP